MGRRRWWGQTAAAHGSMLALALAACDKAAPDPALNATPSPNASILPAPLASVAQPAAESPGWTPRSAASGLALEPGGKAVGGDGGVALVPEVLSADQALDDDGLAQREVVGVSLHGEWRYADLPPGPREGNVAGLEAARRSTAVRMRVDLAAIGRMRIIFQTRALPIERETEVRARSDRYGHLLVWPDASGYRILLPGAVRTVLNEGRADANPLVRPQVASMSEGPRRVGRRTNKWELTTRTGKLSLEQARLVAAGEGAPLLCRFLSEIVAIDPSAAPCAIDEVPVRAQYSWPQGGGVVFEVTDILDKAELPAAQLLVPPAGAEFARTGLPARGSVVLLSREELGALRVRSADPPPPTLPEDGLFLRNTSDILRYAFVDGVPAAAVAPNREVAVQGLVRGRYQVQWRTLLADIVDAPVLVDVPGRLTSVQSDGRDH